MPKAIKQSRNMITDETSEIHARIAPNVIIQPDSHIGKDKRHQRRTATSPITTIAYITTSRTNEQRRAPTPTPTSTQNIQIQPSAHRHTSPPACIAKKKHNDHICPYQGASPPRVTRPFNQIAHIITRFGSQAQPAAEGSEAQKHRSVPTAHSSDARQE